MENVVTNDLLEFIRNSWQVILIVVTALGVGYSIARRLDDLIGKDKDGRTVVDRLEKVEYQLWPNNGTSLADKVAKVQDCQNEMKQELMEIKGETEVIKSMLSAVIANFKK